MHFNEGKRCAPPTVPAVVEIIKRQPSDPFFGINWNLTLLLFLSKLFGLIQDKCFLTQKQRQKSAKGKPAER